MEYKEVFPILEKLDNADDVVDAIKAQVQKVNNEAHGLRSKLKTFEGVDVDKYNLVTKTLSEAGLDLEGDMGKQISSLKASTDKLTDSEKQIQDLTNNLGSLQNRFDEADRKAVKLTQENNKAQVLSAFTGEFEKRVLNPKITLGYHLSEGQLTLGEDGKPGYSSKDGTFYSFDNGAMDQYLTDFPDSAKSSQTGGSGSGASFSNDSNKKTISRSQFNELSATDRVSHFKDGGTVVD